MTISEKNNYMTNELRRIIDNRPKLAVRSDNLTAIIVAAGNSSRMNGKDKLFEEIGGIPVIVHSVMQFANASAPDNIIVVARSSNIGEILRLCRLYNISKPVKAVTGGETRMHSVINGIIATEGNVGYIAVHDGARPLIKPDLIDRVAAEAKISGAAIPAVRVKDTVKKIKNNIVISTPPREFLYAAQTPQIFSLELYLEMLVNFSGNPADITDDSLLFEKSGYPVRIVEGDYENLKITTPNDLLASEILYNQKKG